MKLNWSLILCASALGLGCGHLAAAQSTEPVTVSKVETLVATVESIDQATRMVELRSGERTSTVQVSPEVRNLSKVKVGDEVVVQYYEALGAELKAKGTSTTLGVVEATTGTSRAPQGGQPGAAVANKVTTTVVIEAVDRDTHSLTFTGPAGMTRTIDVKDARAQEFIGTLKKGDEVELTYVEALAVSLQPNEQ